MFSIPGRFAGIKRFGQVLSILSSHGLDFALQKSGFMKRRLFTKEYVSRPVEARIILEDLGGIFVKLGQFMSMRPDLVPREYCEAFSKLQDHVEPFSYEEVQHIISSELKKPLNSIFKEFSKVPVAAASIAQVHKARLKSGQVVAVKVMRPGVLATFETDLEIMGYFARVMKHKLNPKIFDPEEIFEEFRRYTENELDYKKEALNLKTFAQNMKGQGIIVPKAFDSLTTRRVLVMDYIEGVPLSKAMHSPGSYRNFDRKAFCKKLTRAFLHQVFIDGVFHADPHPGNIFVTGKGMDGIALLDFGIVGRIDPELKEKLTVLLIAIVEKDVDGMANALVSMNLMNGEVDMQRLREDIIYDLGEYYDAPIDKMDLAGLIFKVIDVCKHNHIKIPRDFVLLAKCLATLKELCSELDPSFNIIQETRPFAKGIANEKKNPVNIFKSIMGQSKRFYAFAKDVPLQTRKFYGVLDKADVALDSINRDLSVLTREVRREAVRLVLAVIISALIISASITASFDKGLSNIFVIFAGVFMAYLLLSVFADIFKRK
jgi:ubiquinone biosynthesis protein